MDMLTGLRAFVATARTGSFTAAADRMGVSNRLTSKYVADLEQRLGVRLFQRTTRRVGLTPAGEDLLQRAPALLEEFDVMLAETAEGSRALSGQIRVSAPVTFGEEYVACMLGRFVDLHPQVTTDLRLDDRYVDLASGGIDLAFRVGATEMLSARTRKLGQMRTRLVASPEYLSRFGTPRNIADLKQHRFVLDSNFRNPRHWPLVADGREVALDVRGSLQVNSARAACALAVAGRGIAFSPMFAVADHLQAGRLVPLLDGIEGAPRPVAAVYLEGPRLPRKVRALIDFAVRDVVEHGVL